MIQDTPGRYHGYASLSLPAQVEAGSKQNFSVVYRAGDFGIDDSGSIKLCWRFASDIGTPQFSDPTADNYLRITTNADCELHPRFDPKGNTRPWGRTVYVKVQKGYLSPGDTIEIAFHNTEMQTFVERQFRFRLFVDDVATYVYNEVEVAPTVDIVPGPAARLRLYLPSTAAVGDRVSLLVVAEDRWANPTPFDDTLTLNAVGPLSHLPAATAGTGSREAVSVDDLEVTDGGTVRVIAEFRGQRFASNPLVVDGTTGRRLAWADMHGQSRETIGTGTIDDYFRFARDLACVDIAAHQGNDFQITREFWSRLQSVTASFNHDGRFVTFPGYEWSGNTALGGDRNVYFRSEGRHIRRSSHALSPDILDAADDCTTVEELFSALKEEDCIVVPHVGGRYADVFRHDPNLERSVEVHSAWGTFEWMIHDAVRDGHLFGIVATSDGHKGRPGASHPGRGKFGSYGGLTCVAVDELSRDAVWQALKQRRHYATTGARTYLSVVGTVTGGSQSVEVPMGGHIQRAGASGISLSVRYAGTAPVLSVDLCDGLDTIQRYRGTPAGLVPVPADGSAGSEPANQAIAGDRILVWWSGSLRRGRGRQIDWSGECTVAGSTISDVRAVNFHSPDRPLQLVGSDHLQWESFTTGGMSGFVAKLSEPRTGRLELRTSRLSHTVDLPELGAEEVRVSAGGVDAELRVLRLPTDDSIRDFALDVEYDLPTDRRTALYLRIVQEDGTITWSSPIFVEGED